VLVICLFDSSALVAHAMGQAGAEEVQTLIEDEGNDVFCCAITFFELAAVLAHQGSPQATAGLWETYSQCLQVIPVDAALAMTAWRLRDQTGVRIPMAAAMIAASAQSVRATLVHRDQHLSGIPQSLLPQIVLPES